MLYYIEGARRYVYGGALVASLWMWGSTAAAIPHEHRGEAQQATTHGAVPIGQPHIAGTDSREAQLFFDQGLFLIYAFNHQSAIASFLRAIELDPEFAMAYWGIALAESANINSPVTAERASRALSALSKALSLLQHASERDRAYIAALQTRYSGGPSGPRLDQDRDYAEAMERLTKRYPYDTTAWTLHADALMNLTPWAYWDSEGNALPDTPAILRSLERAMALDPEHVGANHYYIHAIEASRQPERALPSALRLSALGLDAGHLVHMPSHIYFRIGDHARVVEANIQAAAADEAYFKSTAAQNRAYRGYYAHNLEFLVVGHSYMGNFAGAIDAADRFDAIIEDLTKSAPRIEHKFTRRMGVLLRFGKWAEVLDMPKPTENRPVSLAYWHYARASALAKLGKQHLAAAERTAFATASRAIPDGAKVSNNTAPELLAIASELLDGRVALAMGRIPEAVRHLEHAVSYQDALAYDEPPNWHYPARETLGAALLSVGRASAAEAVFREDLKRNPRNPRSLFGLAESLKRQGRLDEYRVVKISFDRSWTHADGPIDLDQF